MCQRVNCRDCGKPTFVGCGRHVEQVLSDVLPAQRCRCRETTDPAGNAKQARRGGMLETIKTWMR